MALTVLEDSLHVEAVGGAGLVVGAAFEVVGEFSGPAVVDHSGVGRADGVWEGKPQESFIFIFHNNKIKSKCLQPHFTVAFNITDTI